MEENILEIMNQLIYSESDGVDDAAKEITAHVFKFTLWCIMKAQRSELSIDPASIIFNKKIFTPDELYDYWYKEVCNKNIKQ